MRILNRSHIQLESSTFAFSKQLLLPLLWLFIASCGGGGGSDDPMQPSPPLGNDASLSSLSIGGATLDSAFSSSVTDYTAAVGFATKSTQVTATTEDSNATVSVNGTAVASGAASDPIALDVGSNTVTVNVTAEDGATTRTYTIVVTRAPSDNANLSGLEMTDLVLEPSFHPNQTNYTVTVGVATNSTQVTATADDPDATVRVNGTAVASGASSDPIRLDEGCNTITVNVTAADGTTMQTYTVAVTYQGASAFAQKAYVKASDTGVFDWFGKSVALSADGSTMAVGADDGISDLLFEAIDAKSKVGNSLTGDVHVFTHDSGGTWAQQAYITASNADYPDLFGSSVALSADGTTLAVGAWGESSATTGVNGDGTDNSAWQSGAAYVFTRDGGGTWTQEAYIKASNTDSEDWFGWSVALSADGATLVVGARGESSAATGVNGDETKNSAISSGAVYVFTRDDGGIWTQRAYVKASNTDEGDIFGQSVALSADGATLAVGANGEDSAAIGVNGDDTDNSAPGSGATYVFTRDSSGVWTQQAYVKASNTDEGDWFGQSVALSADGATLAVGAWGESSATTGVNGDGTDNSATNSGAAYTFARDSGGTWTKEAYIKASNTDEGDWFGWSVALSANGATLAMSAIFEDSAATGVNCDATNNSATASGAAYVFTRDSDGVWTQQAYVKASNTDEGDIFGQSVALSADGATLAVGARGESSAATGVNGDETDNTVTDSGAAYTFEL